MLSIPSDILVDEGGRAGLESINKARGLESWIS